MRKGSDIIGQPVFTYDTGEKLDNRIEDLIFDQDSNQLLGFLVDEKGWFRDAQVLPLANVHAIGPDAVVVASASAILNAQDATPLQQILERELVLKGSRIMTTDGRDLGTMIDLFFDEKTGAVEGYEASGGVFADAYSGRSFIPAPHALSIGEDAAFVPPETAEMMEEQVGGIKGAVQTANQKVQDAAQATGAQVQAATATAQANLQAAGQRASETLNQAQQQVDTSIANAVVDPEEQHRFVVGRVATQSVEYPDGTAIVQAGETVTATQADAAAETNLLAQLYRVTGGSVQQRVNEKLQTAMDETSQQVQDAAQRSQTRLQEFQRGASTQMTNAIITPKEQQEFVIGRTANEAVTTPQDETLIKQGETVTADIAEAAAAANCLDLLYAATGGDVRQRAMEQAQTKADEVNQRVQDRAAHSQKKLQAMGQQAQETVSTQTQKLKEKTQAVVSSQTVEETKGHRVQTMVKTDENYIIAAPGQIVTDRVIARAREHQQEAALLSAVGLSSQEAAQSQASGMLSATGDRLQSTTQSAGEQLRQGTEQLQAEADSLWQDVKETVGSLRDRGTQAIEDKRIKGALGRPSTRVILDQQDNVILNTGDLITNQAIDRARQAEVLDLLLDSVYAGDPQISREDLRAERAGQASLKPEST